LTVDLAHLLRLSVVTVSAMVLNPARPALVIVVSVLRLLRYVVMEPAMEPKPAPLVQQIADSALLLHPPVVMVPATVKRRVQAAPQIAASAHRLLLRPVNRLAPIPTTPVLLLVTILTASKSASVI
jgi:hypothetical protein